MGWNLLCGFSHFLEGRGLLLSDALRPRRGKVGPCCARCGPEFRSQDLGSAVDDKTSGPVRHHRVALVNTVLNSPARGTRCSRGDGAELCVRDTDNREGLRDCFTHSLPVFCKPSGTNALERIEQRLAKGHAVRPLDQLPHEALVEFVSPTDCVLGDEPLYRLSV